MLTLRNHNVPLVIFSAGIGNVIDFFLRKTFGGFPNNVHLVSNMMVIYESISKKNRFVMKAGMQTRFPTKICSHVFDENNSISYQFGSI